MSAQSCTAIEKLALSLNPDSNQYQNQNQLTPHFESLSQALIENAGRPEDDNTSFNLVVASFSGLIALAQYSCTASGASLLQMLLPICNMLEQTVSNP